MRDVNNGWLIRYMHSNTASAFFFLVYLHIGRGLYYGSYRSPRVSTWAIGTIILIVMIATGFMGYIHSPKWLYITIISLILHLICIIKLYRKNKILINSPILLNKKYNLYNKSFNYLNKREYSTTPSADDKSERLASIIKELGIDPVFIYENLYTDNIRKQVLNDTRGLSGIYMILNKVTKDYYIGSASTNRLYARFCNHLIYFRGSLWSGISLVCLKLSNSGDILKILILNYNWKKLSGWSNHSGIVTSQNMIEREMDNHGSKSAMLAVNEQRVDDNWLTDKLNNLILSLRCTLTGFEKSYPVRILSNQINKIKDFSTNSIIKLDPWFITGFSDAEGCFTTTVTKDNKSKTGWAVKLSFQIGLHEKDRALLEKIQIFFNGIGNISKHGSAMVHYRVESVKDLAKIIEHFENYPLLTQKWGDFMLFKKAYEIMLNKEHLNKEGLEKFIEVKASINKGLSESLKLAFPNITVLDKPQRENIKIENSQWLAGFASGEGCFYVKITKSSKSKQGFSIQLIFQLTQHIRDEILMRSLIDYLNSGNIFKSQDTYVFEVTKFSDINEKIVPFFKNYPILGSKSLDFSDWNQVIELMKNKAHLTKEGLEQIKLIKDGMNKGRN